MSGAESVLWQLFQYVILPVGSVVLTTLAVFIVRRLGAKLDTEQKAALHAFLTELAAQGVAYAEQLSQRKAKENEKLNGDQKRYLAIEYILKELEKYGMIDIARDEVENLIESVLGVETLRDNQFLNNLPELGAGGNDENPSF